MSFFKLLLVISLCIFVFTSCNPVHYIPHMQNVPVLKEKGDAMISAGISTVGRDSAGQYSLLTAYQFSETMAIKTSSVLYTTRHNFQRNRTRNYGQIHEVGFGVLSPLKNMGGQIGIWGIAGGGRMNTALFRENEILSTNLFIIGLTPTATLETSIYTISFSMKSFFMQYSNTRGNLTFGGVNEVEYLRNNRNALIIEPSITEKIGYKNFRFILQTTFSRNLMYNPERNNHKNGDRQVDILLSFGISYVFKTRKSAEPTDF